MSAPTTTVTGSATPRPARGPEPAAVTLSVALWLGAILAGVAETLVHLAEPEPPSPEAVGLRGGMYLVLAVLVLQLRTGRNAYRWAVAGVLGVFGTLSLVVEPITALVSGTSPVDYLAAASGPQLAAAALRALHVAEVLGALALLFHPDTVAWFRSRTAVPAAPAALPVPTPRSAA
ncbi:hypothetical protein [Pseudonocardia phyllosphaerae]|uniref:hypothetical protein n=1 Tax=Pseudonocardia phyllosphaerae TaxID=3390502 RepID=UPI00397E0925